MATKKKKSWLKVLSIALLIVLLISFAFSFDGSARWLSEKFNMPFEKVKSVTKTIVFISLGLFLISTGAATMAVPVLGAGLIIIGLVLLAYGLWPLFRKEEAPTVGAE